MSDNVNQRTGGSTSGEPTAAEYNAATNLMNAEGIQLSFVLTAGTDGRAFPDADEVRRYADLTRFVVARLSPGDAREVFAHACELLPRSGDET